MIDITKYAIKYTAIGIGVYFLYTLGQSTFWYIFMSGYNRALREMIEANICILS